MKKCKVDFDLIPWESPMNGVRFKPYGHGGKRVRLVEFSRDFVELDWCTKGHIGYILEGEMEIDFDGNIVHFASGDGIFIPTGEEYKHIAKVLTDVIRLILVEDV